MVSCKEQRSHRALVNELAHFYHQPLDFLLGLQRRVGSFLLEWEMAVGRWTRAWLRWEKLLVPLRCWGVAGAGGAPWGEAQKVLTGAAGRAHREVRPWRPSGSNLTFHKWGN